jgi:hypothetical protein
MRRRADRASGQSEAPAFRPAAAAFFRALDSLKPPCATAIARNRPAVAPARPSRRKRAAGSCDSIDGPARASAESSKRHPSFKIRIDSDI